MFIQVYLHIKCVDTNIPSHLQQPTEEPKRHKKTQELILQLFTPFLNSQFKFVTEMSSKFTLENESREVYEVGFFFNIISLSC